MLVKVFVSVLLQIFSAWYSISKAIAPRKRRHLNGKSVAQERSERKTVPIAISARPRVSLRCHAWNCSCHCSIEFGFQQMISRCSTKPPVHSAFTFFNSTKRRWWWWWNGNSHKPVICHNSTNHRNDDDTKLSILLSIEFIFSSSSRARSSEWGGISDSQCEKVNSEKRATRSQALRRAENE